MDRKMKLNKLINRGIKYTEIRLNKDERDRERLFMSADGQNNPFRLAESALPKLEKESDGSSADLDNDEFDADPDSVNIGNPK